MDKPESIIVHLINSFPRPIGRTTLTKLLYLIDYYHVQTYDHPVTSFVYKRDSFGPYDYSLADVLAGLLEKQVLVEESYERPSGRTGHRYRSHIGHDLQLPEDLQGIVSFVLQITSDLPDEDILALAYETPPMKALLQREREVNRLLLGEHLDLYLSDAEIFRPDPRAVADALYHMDKEDPQVSDEDYAETLIREYEELEPIRRGLKV